ncbi:hypothetical protein MINT15_14910 [Saccharomonospora viridis]|uniref:Uncharacterized protein n=1 Tax=Saccharomonospora viridis TaxID=1852 RepID=A0A837D9R7_9PSEU|nr:hypothetical protein MINT15_14910 [Saccharomonospora viridis]
MVQSSHSDCPLFPPAVVSAACVVVSAACVVVSASCGANTTA